ncbi:hypothetical protein NE857_12940 [Nocardiopsis exhalans]|uniref:Uncharacterized protein n=1 Tax=Nocardiopsis exhalans TaxID=163604 RepID=A0ABY5DG22_9ACTN|nr:hypothetical protein [Nocardiopsis exhalans]USY22428.1 hypothetical protein NE857_12940 [Nocardiopsis exhalans]
MLAGPDPELRGAALRAVRTLPIPDPMVLPVLEDAPTALRPALYRTLDQGRRSALADALLARVRSEHGDAEAAALLPACTAETVARHLPGLAHAFQSWRRLARRHPDTSVDPFTQLLRDGRALDRVEEVFGRLLAGQPAGVPLRLSDGETSIRPVARLRSVARACAGLIQPNGAVPADLAVRPVRLLGEHPQHLAGAVRLTDALFQARAGEGAAPAELVAVFATVLEQLARHPLSLLGWLRNLVRPVASGLRARGSGDGEALTLTGLLLERARRLPGPEGAAAGLFAVLVAEEFGNRSRWARRWSESLVAAGECGHDQVRELARAVALG